LEEAEGGEAMSGNYITLNIERRGSDFALVRSLDGKTTEIHLLESDILSLARIFPSYARALNARRMPLGSDISACVAIPLKEFAINSDMHRPLILLRMIDTNDADFDFSFETSGARNLAEVLIKWADKIDSAPKLTRQ
jgi:hypothetical protein